MNWRPDSWENPIPVKKPIPDKFPYYSAYHKHLTYEAGADAMLNAIIDQLESCESEEDKLFFVYQLIHERIKEKQNG